MVVEFRTIYLNRISVQTNDRISIFGKTGTGKTELFKRGIMPNLYRYVFWDIKRENDDVPNDAIITTPKELEEKIGTTDKILYQPDNPEEKDFNDVCKVIFNSGYPNTFYIDEVAFISKTNKIEYYHKVLMTQGRSKGIGVINVSQRPHDIHNTLISESEHLFVFKLTLPTDISKIDAIIGEDAAAQVKVLPYHYFVYYNERENILQVFSPLYIDDPGTPKLVEYRPTLEEYLKLIQRG